MSQVIRLSIGDIRFLDEAGGMRAIRDNERFEFVAVDHIVRFWPTELISGRSIFENVKPATVEMLSVILSNGNFIDRILSPSAEELLAIMNGDTP